MDEPSEPKALRSSAVREERLRVLRSAPHMQALVELVETLRSRIDKPDHVPHFDPISGGVNARALLLYEAAGPGAVRSGFASIDNNDNTAAYTFRTYQKVGLRREDTLQWNVVPWYLGDGTRIRAANSDDLREGAEPTAQLLVQLPKVSIVLLVGGKAGDAWDAHAPANLRTLDVRRTPHPSPTNMNTRPAYAAKWLADMGQLAHDLR